MAKKKWIVLGLMSGTSLDGLDLALCEFSLNQSSWNFKILKSHHVPYSLNEKKILLEAETASGKQLIETHHWFGKFCAQQIEDNFKKEIPQINLISQHGHTIFHEPEKGYSFQIGEPTEISAKFNIPVVFDFRNLDIKKGGQGAPLVPFGDSLLFKKYDACLNLGGIANISAGYNNNFIALDICFCNIALNYLANKLQMPFDESGKIAASGSVNSQLLTILLTDKYLKLNYPKSLDKQYFFSFYSPLIKKINLSPVDLLATFSYFIATIISNTFKTLAIKSVLITGGGAYNKHLITLISQQTEIEIVIPKKPLIEFKEALIFAFLGLQRFIGKSNIYGSYTGAKSDSISGNISGF